MLALREVTKVYRGARGVSALSGVSLDIHAGEFVAIEGPSGGGKSTLLNVLGLLDRSDSGSYLIGGVDTADLDDRDLTRLRASTFSYVFQRFHLLEGRPVRDSVAMGLQYQVASDEDTDGLIRGALARVGLVDHIDQNCSTLSGGESQRVAIARALVASTPVLLADEPTGNLDRASGEAVMQVLESLWRDGVTVVLVTHDAELAARAPRRLRLVDGAITADVGGPAANGGLRVAGVVPHHPDTEPTAPRRSARRRIHLISDALASLGARRRRTVGLAGTVALAVALSVATMGLSQSARAQVSATFDEAGSRDVTMIDEVSLSPEDSDAMRDAAPATLERLQSVAGVDAVAMTASCGDQVVRVGPSRAGYDAPMYVGHGAVDVATRGSLANSNGGPFALGEGEAIVGRLLADAIDLGPLEGPPTITVNGRSLEVVGVLDAAARAPELLGAVLVGGRNPECSVQSTTWWVLTVPGAAQQVGEQVALAADPVHPLRYSVVVPPDPTNLRGSIEQSVGTTLAILTAVAFLVAVGALTNAMNMAVSERQRELGLRRAVGARKRDLAALLSSEAFVLGLVGGFVGLVMGVVAILGVTVAMHWTPVFDVTLAPFAVVGGAVLGVVGSVWAALRAAGVRPAEALRS